VFTDTNPFLVVIMKYSAFALAASSFLGGAAAAAHGHHHHHRRHHNPLPHDQCEPPEVPVPCTTYVTSYLVPVEYTAPPPPPVEPTTTVTSTSVYEEVTTSTSVAYIEIPHGPIPTPEVTTCPTPGTYVIPEKTMTLTSTEYLCKPETTQLPPGTHTYGGVTTIVETQTTVTCPVAVTETVDETVTSKVVMTTYVCPTPGTYTIGPITTTVTQTTVVDCEYPVVTSYNPGTYTRPETTITVTKTDEVYVCPTYEEVIVTQTVVPVPETSAPVDEPETYPTAPVDEPETYPTAPVDEPETYPTSVPVEEKPEVPTEVPVVEPTEVPEPAPEPTEVPEPETPVDLPVGSGGPAMAITYSPYNDDSTCKSADQVDADIKEIVAKGFKTIRLYSSDCNGLETVGKACETYQVKIVIGIFIRDSTCRADKDLSDIMAWGKWNLIEMFVVGNEALFQGFCSADVLAKYISEVGGKIKSNGFNGPVTTTEPLNVLEQHYQVLCPAMDVVSINSHPYFNPDVAPSGAGAFLNAQLQRAEELCGKTGYVLEAGWPNAGNTNGKAIASPDAQKEAFQSILSECPTERIVLFTYRNDYWKAPGAYNVEQNFGCGELF